MNTIVFTAGDGQRYGLVSLPDSGEVVVFRDQEGVWRGHVEFNFRDSTGLAPGEALPEVAAALNAAVIA